MALPGRVLGSPMEESASRPRMPCQTRRAQGTYSAVNARRIQQDGYRYGHRMEERTAMKHMEKTHPPTRRLRSRDYETARRDVAVTVGTVLAF